MFSGRTALKHQAILASKAYSCRGCGQMPLPTQGIHPGEETILPCISGPLLVHGYNKTPQNHWSIYSNCHAKNEIGKKRDLIGVQSLKERWGGWYFGTLIPVLCPKEPKHVLVCVCVFNIQQPYIRAQNRHIMLHNNMYILYIPPLFDISSYPVHLFPSLPAKNDQTGYDLSPNTHPTKKGVNYHPLPWIHP